MNKITGRIASVLAGAAVLAVILMIVLRPLDKDTEQPVVSPSPSAVVTGTPTPEVSPTDGQNAEESPPPPSAEPITGTQYECIIPGGLAKLAITIPGDFSHIEEEFGHMFPYTPANDMMVLLEIVFREGSAQEAAAGFLTGYMPDYTDYIDPVTADIGNVSDAIYISLWKSGQYIEAWLIDVGGAYFAVVAGYDTDEQRELFRRVADTVVLTK